MGQSPKIACPLFLSMNFYFFSEFPREPVLLEPAPELRELDDCVPRDELEDDEEWPLSEPE